MARRKIEPLVETRRGLAAAVADRLIANPAATGGGVIMLAIAAAIMTNALALQPGRHPAPLFSGTSPFGAAEPAATGSTAEPKERDAIGELLGGVPAVDPGLVSAIQGELKARGYYAGVVDGLPGPMTSDAILRFQQDHRLRQTGEPTSAVLADLRAAPKPRTDLAPQGDTHSEESVPQPPSAPVAADARPSTPPVAVPLPKRSPVRGAALAEDVQVRPASVQTVRLDTADAVTAEPAVAHEASPAVNPAGDPRIARIEEALDLLGYGPVAVDGRIDGSTRAAVRRFQENRRIPVTGEIDQAFLNELVKIGGLVTN